MDGFGLTVCVIADGSNVSHNTTIEMDSDWGNIGGRPVTERNRASLSQNTTHSHFATTENCSPVH